jgi:hypothetical protein
MISVTNRGTGPESLCHSEISGNFIRMKRCVDNTQEGHRLKFNTNTYNSSSISTNKSPASIWSPAVTSTRKMLKWHKTTKSSRVRSVHDNTKRHRECQCYLRATHGRIYCRFHFHCRERQQWLSQFYFITFFHFGFHNHPWHRGTNTTLHIQQGFGTRHIF